MKIVYLLILVKVVLYGESLCEGSIYTNGCCELIIPDSYGKEESEVKELIRIYKNCYNVKEPFSQPDYKTRKRILHYFMILALKKQNSKVTKILIEKKLPLDSDLNGMYTYNNILPIMLWIDDIEKMMDNNRIRKYLREVCSSLDWRPIEFQIYEVNSDKGKTYQFTPQSFYDELRKNNKTKIMGIFNEEYERYRSEMKRLGYPKALVPLKF